MSLIVRIWCGVDAFVDCNLWYERAEKEEEMRLIAFVVVVVLMNPLLARFLFLFSFSSSVLVSFSFSWLSLVNPYLCSPTLISLVLISAQAAGGCASMVEAVVKPCL